MKSSRWERVRRTGSDRIKQLASAGLVLCVALGCVAWTSAGAASSKHGHHHHHHHRHGQRGRRGATGPAGPAGRAGSGSLTLTYVSKTYAAAAGVPAGSQVDRNSPDCPKNEDATGGGVTSDASAPGDPKNVYVEAGNFTHGGGGSVGGQSFFFGGWDATVDNRDTAPHSLTVWAVCTPTTHAAPAKSGPRGPRGATGPAGPAGAAGGGSVALDYVTKQFNGTNGNTTGTATCPAGEHATDGGVESAAPFEKQWVTDTAPAAGGSGWTVSVDTFGSAQKFTVYAICTTSTVAPAPAADAKRGPRGPRGATGPAGPPGPSTPVASIPLTEVDAEAIPAPAGQQSSGSADCPAGQLVIGGAYFNDGVHNDMALNSVFPTATRASWQVTSDNIANQARDFDADALCTPAKVVAKR